MGARILVIEDNPANLDLMVYLLEAFGHTTRAIQDGAPALETALRERPDLIICDVHLPGIDGYEVVRSLKGDPDCRSIPVVAVTALAMVGDRDRVLEAGFDGYLMKPIDPESFVEQIGAFLNPGHGHAKAHRKNGIVKEVQPAPASGGRGTVLVVDDSAANQELAHAILQPSGFSVITCSGMREALEAARRNIPDLILSDADMAKGHGFDLIRAIKGDAGLAGIPLMVSTSTMLAEEDRAQALALGADRFLIRPIDPGELLEEIAACLRTKEGCGQDPGSGRQRD